MIQNLKNEHTDKIYCTLKLGLYYGLVIGTLVGISRCLLFIQQNQYTPYNLKCVIQYLFKYSINQNVLSVSAASIIILIIVNYVERTRKLIFPVFITLLIFMLGGYYLNKNVFPGIFENESIIGNVLLFILSLGVGFVFFKYFKFELNSQKLSALYNKTTFFLLIALFLILNVAANFISTNNNFINTSKVIPDKKFIDLFNLNYPGLEEVKIFAQKKQFDMAKEKLLSYYKSKKIDSSLVVLKPIEQSDLAQLLRGANEIMEHKFTNLGKMHYLGDQIIWSKNPERNSEWIWKLNRHAQWLRLALAYHWTKDEKYAIEFNNQLLGWIKNNPPQKWKNEKSFTWRLMDVGERMFVSWIKLFQIFNSSTNFTDEARTVMIASIYNHAQFLKIFKSPIRNHLLMESRGLAFVSFYFSEFKLMKEWGDIAFERVEHAAETEINVDGSYCELSPGYHYLALLQFESFLNLSKKIGRSLNIDDKIIKMYAFLMDIMRPDGKIPQINDGIPPNNLRSILQRTGKKYNRPEFIYQGTLGKEGQRPDYESCQLPNAGFYLMRSDWSESANFLFFDAGPYGSAHGHDDKLGFECCAFGKTLIVDAGQYTSDRYDRYIDYFHRSQGHNTIIVDGKSQARFWNKKVWIYNSSYKNNNVWQSNQKYDYVVGDYDDGYGNNKEKIDRSVKHVRKILFIKPEYWVISDLLMANDEHIYEQLFHFVPIKLFVNENKTVFTNNLNEPNLAMLALDPENLDLQIFEGSEKPIQGWVSINSNIKHAAPAVIYTKKAEGSTTFNTILYPLSQGQNIDNAKLEKIAVTLNEQELNPTEGICLKFTHKKWIDYIMISHGTIGIKSYYKFKSNADVAYCRTNENGEVIEKFEINQ